MAPNASDPIEIIELVDHIPPLLIVGAIVVGVIVGAVAVALFTETTIDA